MRTLEEIREEKYFSLEYGGGQVCLDGWFTPEELILIAAHAKMRREATNAAEAARCKEEADSDMETEPNLLSRP